MTVAEEETVGAVVSVVEESSEGAVVVVDAFSSLIEHQETITAMLTIRTNQDNKTFILFLFKKY